MTEPKPRVGHLTNWDSLTGSLTRKKKKKKSTQRGTIDGYTQRKNPCEDTIRKWPFTSQGERLQETAKMLTP